MGRSSLSKTQRGFTLIELMVVVAIIGLMTAAIAVNTSAARVQSRDAKRKTDAANVAAALEVYYSEKRVYPDIETFSDSWKKLQDWSTDSGATKFFPIYISSWPSDPLGTDGSFGQGYVYQVNPTGFPNGASSASLFAIDVPLEEKSDSDAIDPALVSCSDPTNIHFFVTGVISCSGYHYRISSR